MLLNSYLGCAYYLPDSARGLHHQLILQRRNTGLEKRARWLRGGVPKQSPPTSRYRKLSDCYYYLSLEQRILGEL